MSARTTRYRDVLPVDSLTATAATIIGIGAIGRQVALQLAAMGIGQLQLIDFDRVDDVNLGPQGYGEADIGSLKTDVTAADCLTRNSGLMIDTLNDRFHRDQRIHPVVFCCVDSIGARKTIWRGLSSQCQVLIDGRMAAETMRVLTAHDGATREQFQETLFSNEDAYRASCTAKSTLYCASIAAGLMITQFVRWLNHQIIESDVQVNLLGMELITTPAPTAHR